MTDPILAAFEQASRIYCTKCGDDPDILTPAPMHVQSKIVGAETLMVPYWHHVAHQLNDLSLQLTSLREAAIQQSANEPRH